MIIGYVAVEIKLFGVESLKEKRSIVKRFLNQIRKRFNISVCELDRMDSKEYLVIGMSMISNDRKHVDQVISEVTRFVEAESPGMITDVATGLV